MIDQLDKMLCHLLMSQVVEISNDAQIGFQPPDEDWRNNYMPSLTVGGQVVPAVNLYLADLRENRKLRSNERLRPAENHLGKEEPAPVRVDCHYLITAWSPAVEEAGRTADEHRLLYQVAAALIRNAPLNPSRIYGGQAPPPPEPPWPEEFWEADLPTVVLPSEGFPKLAEFWGTMGVHHRWKPVVYLVVTLPVALPSRDLGPMVTTKITEYRWRGSAAPGEILMQIGGQVLTAGTPCPVAQGNALITAVHPPGTTVTVNNASPFRVGDVITENQVLRATIIQIQGNNLILDSDLGLAPPQTLHLAHIIPTQSTFRLLSVTGLQAGGLAELQGREPGTGANVLEQVLLERVDAATGFVTLSPAIPRTRTYDLEAPPAAAPVLRPLTPAVNAWVRLEDIHQEPLQTITTNAKGRFTFVQIRAGNYNLRVRATGFPEVVRSIEVPSPTGEYDVTLR